MNRLKGMLRRGYTLVELLVVVVIIGILSAVGAGVYLHVQQNASDQMPKQHLLDAWRSAQQAAADNGSGHTPSGNPVQGVTSAANENTYPAPTSSLLDEMTAQTPTLKIKTTANTAGVIDSSAVYVDTTRSTTTTTVLYAVTNDKRIWELIAHVGDQTPVMHTLLSLTTVAPKNDFGPTISGIAAQTGTLSVDPGAWASDTAPVYTYQWRRCDATGANCSNIAGATNQTYSPVAADVSQTLRAVVTATNTHGAASATSAQTKAVIAVQNPGPIAAILPTVSGLAQELQTLTAKPGNWTGSPPITLSYQWRRCDTSGANCTDIAGQTGLTYALTAADVGSTIRFQVTGSDSKGTNVAASNQTATVTPAPPQNTVLPQISGTAQDQQTLTTSNGTWIGANITYTYQWRRCDTSGANCSNIAGATNSSYLLTGSDIGATIRVNVTATNITGTTPATSAQTATVVAAPPANTALPTISGTVSVGSTLTATNGSWTGSTPINYTYQWRRCDNTGASCADIAGATGSTYVLAGADAAGTVRIKVTATNTAGTTSATSNQTAVIPPGSGTVTITGAPVVGQTLTATTSGWSGVTSYSYQWRTCDASGNNCSDMAGQTTSTYAPSASDIGNTLRVKVTATNSGGQATVTSSQTAVISYGFPAGTVLAFAGASVPSGWAVTDGSCGYSSGANPDLYAAIGTIYGGTSGNFCIPDLRGRFPLGKAASGTGSTLGGSGGISLGATTTINLPSASFTYNWSESPPAPGFASHAHTWYGPWGAVWVKSGPCQYCDNEPYAPVNYYATTESGSVSGISRSATSSTITPTVNVSYGDPPYAVIRYIIALSATSGANAPCGSLLASGSSTVPSGALAADGTNAAGCLAAGYSGNLPDLRNRFPVGQAASGTGSTLGATGGALTQTHSLVLPNQSATVSNSYSATINMSSPAHSDAESRGQAGDNSGCGCYTSNPWGGSSPMSHNGGSDNGAQYSSNTFTLNTSTSAVGGQTQNATSQSPWQAVKWIGYNSSGFAPATGVITAYAGSSAPNGWIFADGSCYATTGTYASLYAALGYTYGGSGGTFCVPDLRGRLPLGAGTNALGTSGGARDAAPQVTFSAFTPQLTVPAHTFSWNIPAHQHNDAMYKDYTCCDMSTDSANMYAIQQYAGTYSWNYAWTSADGGQTVNSSVGTQTVNPTAGYGAQTVTMSAINPPFVAVNYIIKY